MDSINVDVTLNNIHIVDSYNVSKRDFDVILNDIEYGAIPCNVFENRSRKSLKMEWATHNFCYRIGYKRPQTKDVDLNYPCDLPEWVYIIVGSLSWIFIK